MHLLTCNERQVVARFSERPCGFLEWGPWRVLCITSLQMHGHDDLMIRQGPDYKRYAKEQHVDWDISVEPLTYLYNNQICFSKNLMFSTMVIDISVVWRHQKTWRRYQFTQQTQYILTYYKHIHYPACYCAIRRRQMDESSKTSVLKAATVRNLVFEPLLFYTIKNIQIVL